MKRKNKTALILLTLVLGMILLLTGCGKKNENAQYTWWAVSGDPLHYGDYAKNPVVEYVTQNVKFKDSNGEMKNISFDFKIPASTEAARKDFSNKINSRSFENIFDPTMYDGALADLYENGVILDLTPYVTSSEYMPNLAKFIEDNPDITPFLQTTLSDGSRKYLSIPSVSDVLDPQQQAFGYNYRRDWLVKYGTQPEYLFDPMKDANPIKNEKAGESFKGAFVVKADGTRLSDAEIEKAYSNDTILKEGMNGDSWEDDLVFPSGSKHPIYISDWMWMFEIYEIALEKEGITDENAYIMSLFYPGYIANGDFVSGFGGGGPLWYKDKDNNPAFGATSQGFRAYLECMNDWYNRGWIDQHFTEKTQPFYQTDNERVASGKVPVWMGNSSRVGIRLVNNGSGYEKTIGSIVYCAATPINDIPAYDGKPTTTNYEEKATSADYSRVKNGGEGSLYMLQIPTVIFQNERLGGGVVISQETEKNMDLQLLLSFFDYFYSEEGATFLTAGLNKEQYEKTKNETYTKNGLTNGAHSVIEVDGKIKYLLNPIVEEDKNGIFMAAKSRVIPGLKLESRIQYSYPEIYLENRAQWTKYEATGFNGGMINSQLTPEENDAGGSVNIALENNFLYKNVYKFVKGESSLSDSSWNSFCASIANFRNKGKTLEDVRASLQSAYDRIFK